MNDEKRTALYVRIPQSHAEKLDRVAFELKVPKQDLVAGLVEDMKIAPGFTRRRTEGVEVDDTLRVRGAVVVSPARAVRGAYAGRCRRATCGRGGLGARDGRGGRAARPQARRRVA